MKTAIKSAVEMRHLSFDGFVSKFKPLLITGTEASCSFSEMHVHPVDSDIVIDALKNKPEKVWTFYGMDSLFWLGSEIGYVNREGYVITEISKPQDFEIQVHDDIWVQHSKFVITCDKTVDRDAVEEFVGDGIDDVREQNLGLPYDINYSFEWLEKTHSDFLIVEIDSYFDDVEPTSEILQALHQRFVILGQKIVSDNEGISLSVHEDLNLRLCFGEDSITDKSTE